MKTTEPTFEEKVREFDLKRTRMFAEHEVRKMMRLERSLGRWCDLSDFLGFKFMEYVSKEDREGGELTGEYEDPDFPDTSDDWKK